MLNNVKRSTNGQENPTSTILIYRKPDTADFMASLPDDMHLGEIAMPGTHESCAMYGCACSLGVELLLQVLMESSSDIAVSTTLDANRSAIA